MSVIHIIKGDEPLASPSLPLLYNLVYCSRATAGVDDDAVTRILESAKRFNPAHGITGLLVFGSGIFFQWIEGPRENVARLMTMIHADPRHESIVLLSEFEEVRERLFPDWDMELVAAADIRDVLVDAKNDAEDEKNAAVLTLLIEQLDSGQLSELSRA